MPRLYLLCLRVSSADVIQQMGVAVSLLCVRVSAALVTRQMDVAVSLSLSEGVHVVFAGECRPGDTANGCCCVSDF